MMIQTIGKKKNTYTMWVDTAQKNAPVRYEMMGYDTLLGSHYDRYYVNYMSFDDNSTMDINVFTVPPSKWLW